MKSLKKDLLIAASIFTFALVGCGPTADTSLLTDSSTDPSSHALDKTPNANDLMITSSSVNISVPTANTKVEITGDCAASTYPYHYIVAKYNGGTLGLVDLNTTLTAATANKAQCKNGRFALAISINGWAVGQYILELQMVAYNTPSQLVTNDVRGRFQFNLTKY
ncbi:hypothetical protein [Bdellovibrio sp. HCB2-146]|uniref:hypothetical protein n=1 Tax=Bdellovibrio sp. HCB2-146 TaxID=3394362 RepID=UPI0039BC9546